MDKAKTEGKSVRSKAVNGMVWTAVEKFGNELIQLVIGIAIARILMPSDYGIIGMTAIFTALATTFVDSGFGNALIRKKDRNEADFATCFYFNIAVGIVAYLILFLCAPAIAEFYHIQLLRPVIRVVGLTFFINSLSIAQTARLTSDLKFKQLSLITLSTNLLAGIAGLIMAIAGMGVWALVFQMVGASLLRLMLIEAYTRWVPRTGFSRASFRYLFSFGSRLLGSSLINTLYINIYTLVIGRVYNAADVGYYNRGNQFARLPSQTVLDTVMKVAYPVLAEVQDDPERLASGYRKFLRIPVFLLYPTLALLIALSTPFIDLLLGAKWLPCVPYLQILALGSMFTPLSHINLNILYVKGRTDLVLRLEIIKKTIAFAILFASIQFGIMWLIAGKAIYELIAYAFNCYYTGRFINFGFWQQMLCNVPVTILAAVSGGVAYLAALPFSQSWLQLLCGVMAGGAFYLAVAWGVKDPSLVEIISIIRKKR